MAHSLSAKKRIRQNIKNRARNRWRLRALREALKEFNDKLIHSTEADATESLKKLAQLVDKTAAKGVIHKNQAARRKSRLVHRLRHKFSAEGQAAAAKLNKGKKVKTA